MSTEAKINGKPVEAEVDEKETKSEEPKKEEPKMKKTGKAKKIVVGIVGGLAAAGAVALGVFKVLAAKDSAPELTHLDSTSEDSDSYSNTKE